MGAPERVPVLAYKDTSMYEASVESFDQGVKAAPFIVG